MRLSEAIATGRMLVHAVPGVVLSYDGLNGCALGMGYIANGGQIDFTVGIGLETPMRTWPWLAESHALPCRCNISCGLTNAQIIAHLFDYHIMGCEIGLSQGEGVEQDWTLDQLIDWIASVEPAEVPAAPLEHQAAEPITASAAVNRGAA